MDKFNEIEATTLFETQDQYKDLLYNCTNKKQEKQIRNKLKEIQEELNFIYIN